VSFTEIGSINTSKSSAALGVYLLSGRGRQVHQRSCPLGDRGSCFGSARIFCSRSTWLPGSLACATGSCTPTDRLLGLRGTELLHGRGEGMDPLLVTSCMIKDCLCMDKTFSILHQF